MILATEGLGTRFSHGRKRKETFCYTREPSAHGGFHFGEGQKRTIGKIFLALSRDVGTVRVHRDSIALFRCKSGTGPRPGITLASPSIVFVIVALHYIMCSNGGFHFG